MSEVAQAELPLLDGLEPVNDVLVRLKAREDRRHDTFVSEPIDLNLRWEEAGVGRPEGRFYMTIDGIDMPLTDGAEYTACTLIDQKNPKWFRKFGDPDYFPKSFRNFQHREGFLVRHDGHEIQAVLPESWRVMDCYPMLNEDFVPLVEDSFGKIRGVQHMFDGDGDQDSFRIACGPNIVPSVGDEYGQHMMFMLAMSENGLRDTRTWVGLYRSVSRTSALRGQTASKWSHRVSPETFMNRTSEMVRSMTYFQAMFGRVMQSISSAPMPLTDENDRPLPVADVLRLLKRGRLITKSHYDATKVFVTQLTEDGRPHETQYDLFVACTRGAADIANQKLREKAEEQTLLLFTERGGLPEQLKRAGERVPDLLDDDD